MIRIFVPIFFFWIGVFGNAEGLNLPDRFIAKIVNGDNVGKVVIFTHGKFRRKDVIKSYKSYDADCKGKYKAVEINKWTGIYSPDGEIFGEWFEHVNHVDIAVNSCGWIGELRNKLH